MGNRMPLAHADVALLPPERAPQEAARLIAEVANPEVRDELFWALTQCGAPALEVLAEVATAQDESMRWHAVEAMRHLGGRHVVAPLIAALEDDAFAVRWAAAHGPIDAGEPALVPLLRALVTRPASLAFHGAARRVLRAIAARGAGAEALASLIAALGRETSIYESGVLALEQLERLRRAPPPPVQAWRRDADPS